MEENRLKQIIAYAMDGLEAAVTLIDDRGVMLYYNKQAESILDRKPGYIGKEVYSHHKKDASSKKLESMVHEFKNGRRVPFSYEAAPYGKPILVTVTPIVENGRFIGCTQSVVAKG